MRSTAVGGLVMAAALLLADCSTTPAPIAVTKIPNGTVVVVRAVRLPDDSGQAQLRLLYAIGVHDSTRTQKLVEVIVRKDSGGTVALVQPPRDGVRPGARVVVDETGAVSQ
ncbi:MAG TPA: hypothetical protein VLI93_05825 [Acetobacteraceae bacterium]|nr:hypothetical protein [Acetobacteraceae bacterium]